MKNILSLLVFFISSNCCIISQSIISEKNAPASLSIKTATSVIPIYTDSEDFTLVQKVATILQQDITNVTGLTPRLIHSLETGSKNIIIIGSREKSSLIRQLIAAKKLLLTPSAKKWEGYQVQVIHKPFKGVDHALVIAGNDRRGTAYGVLELSKQIGVSPWYWWADVPVKPKKELFARDAIIISDAPKIKYRGIFINDEAPALSGWTREKFGGFNHHFYERVFELMLRLKANYLWPAMWGNAFYDDDSLNGQTADDYGIVIGTSHHEPLMRAHDEWRRYGQGKWNYDSNASRLQEFWKQGMQRATNEKIVSIGMRGDGDEPMTEKTATALLERIVNDQRKIITDVTGKPAAQTPQLWALYKEVQDYYDKGMRVPDDVTLLLCDDNWGNIRKLPRVNEKPRKGGYGIYYHFDYVGGPRNYKWVNTNPLPRVWEQMHLAWQYKAREIWIVNVGDIKPMELPISFFLDYAWNPEKIAPTDIQTYTERWSAQQFGEIHAKGIARILATYAKYNGRRKPELLDEKTYDAVFTNEAWQVTNDYKNLLALAEKIYTELPAAYRDAYFQLVLHPVKACSNLQEMYFAVARNHFAFMHNDPSANQWAEKAKKLFENDSLITLEYHQLGNGKWNHMMSQAHIGYTYWQQPPRQKMPELKNVDADPNYSSTLMVETEPVSSLSLIPKNAVRPSFYELNGIVSIEADHYSRAIGANGVKWQVLPDHGRTGSAITPFPVTATKKNPGANAPHVEYEIYLADSGMVNIEAYFSPTLNFHNEKDGLQYAISIDEEQPQRVNINAEDKNVQAWQKWVANNIIIKKTTHRVAKSGRHVLKYWMVHPGVVLQKLVVSRSAQQPRYLGPEETIWK